jgi:DNA-binding NarL/FixJ family response regulator
MKRKADLPVLKIMTVDDSPIIVRRIAALLTDIENVKVLGNADRILSALDMIDREVPDVVILDIHLKEDKPANGIHLLVMLKEKYPQMKVIMLTNMSAPQYRSTCMSIGADYFFDKSNDFEKINDALQAISHAAH